jgi:hypothetical protein
VTNDGRTLIHGDRVPVTVQSMYGGSVTTKLMIRPASDNATIWTELVAVGQQRIVPARSPLLGKESSPFESTPVSLPSFFWRSFVLSHDKIIRARHLVLNHVPEERHTRYVVIKQANSSGY